MQAVTKECEIKDAWTIFECVLTPVLCFYAARTVMREGSELMTDRFNCHKHTVQKSLLLSSHKGL